MLLRESAVGGKLEVEYYNETVFEMTLDAGTYHKIHYISDDAAASEYSEMRYQLGCDMEDCLRSVHGDDVSVHEPLNEADCFVLETNIRALSDALIKNILLFLSAKCSLYSVIIVLYQDMADGSTYLGRAIVSLKRIGVTMSIKEVFETACGNSLRKRNSMLTFDEAG